MLEIDGSHGEGGGQILRTAVSLSALTGKEVRISNIRANRPKPGLSNQHITAINAVAKLCSAEVSEMKLGTTSLEFHPSELEGGEYRFDVLTAGSVTLVLQACLMPSIFTPEETTLRITGGTDVKWSPPIDYLRFVLKPLLEKMGVENEIDTIQKEEGK
jgi:RNA 3'-phosphate cyclase